MPDATPAPLDSEPAPPPRPARVSDEVAYVLPMAVFLLFTFVGGKWKALYPLTYVAKTAVVGAMLVVLWRHFTRVRWSHAGLGVVVGVIGIFQWVPMQRWLQQFDFFRPPGADEVFDPFRDLPAGWVWPFVVVRLVGAVTVVPVMEELFWRDYLWRQILAPNDFKLARVGEWAWGPFLAVAGAFALVHGNWWLTSIVWALMVGALLVYTKSLGACIIAHAVTNLLLGVYVLWMKDWAFW